MTALDPNTVNTDPTWEAIDQRLQEALLLDDSARAAFLATLHSTQPLIAKKLERLLGYAYTADALDGNVALTALARTTLEVVAQERIGERFGPWSLQAFLGAGGMADVYLASRALELGSQRAAIKLAHSASATSSMLLVKEAQTLAKLSDPRIAQFLDSGRTDAGEPWIAMEYVEGMQINTWCDQANAPPRERVRLMIDVALAVDHAHRNLIVHRDIKPSNIFVTAQQQQIKLLDFGISRPTPSDNPETTRTALRAFTHAYASPEQIAGELVAVASDVYQLGAVLYLLLCGERPFDDLPRSIPAQLALMAAGPLPPSTRLAANSAGTRPPKDLDTIVLKAMAFDGARRYLSAREFAEDLRRWLNGDPIAARPDRLYRIGRALKRHWGLVASGLLMALLTANYVFNLRDRSALLETQRQRTERVLDVAVQILNESDPFVADSSIVSADAALKRVRDQLEQSTLPDPEFKTRIYGLLSSIYGRRGKQADALALSEQAYQMATATPLSEKLRADSALALARLYHSSARNHDAQRVLDDNAERLRAMHFATRESLLARIDQHSGRGAAALARLEAGATILAAKPLDYERRALWNQLAIARGGQRDYSGSIAAAKRAFDGFEPTNGAEIASWFSYGMNLAVAYGEARQYAKAAHLQDQMADWARRTLGPEHSQLAMVERSRATGLLRVARFREALTILNANQAAAQQQQMAIHRDSYLTTTGLAQLYAGEPNGALLTLLQAATHALQEFGELPGFRESTEEDLAWALFEAGAYRQAWLVARELRSTPSKSYRKAAMVRVLTARLGVHSEAVDEDRAELASRPCAAPDLAVMEAVVDGRPTADMELPNTCDGHAGARMRALGGQWTPDWLADFPLQEFESSLVSRWRAGNFANQELRPDVAQAWQQWWQLRSAR